MTRTAPVASRRSVPLRALASWAAVPLLVVALALLLVSHQPSGSSGHVHGPGDGVHQTAGAIAEPGGHDHAADAPRTAASPAGHGSPTNDHDHETLVACTLLAALTLLALRRLRPRPAGRAVWAPAPASVLLPALPRTARVPGTPEPVVLGISRT
ncbi:hypothetical protein [Isoptericola sediminis]|uniref:Uncharacterized protein n=1 Tax=Isoptericola sediminis TaxID=2733572 RepID=A0A849K389_9MICO|nr:hypothetical protein [Isoptericola sediminis]NNU26245.1 hypothetical protein [Isoptericola sediminis]